MSTAPNGLVVRPMREADLPEADRVMRLAFGTFIGLPDPLTFLGDAVYVRNRFLTDPSAAFTAEVDGAVVGSNFAANWGSVGCFGPLTVRPDLWDRGVGQRLLEPVVDLFGRWRTRLAGLYTFAQSPKHIAFYQKFGFWPRCLTTILARPITPTGRPPQASWYSEKPDAEQQTWLDACRDLTEAVY
jgi:GNAT superfamily N-acetyltransferase